MAACFWAYPKSFTAPEVSGLAREAGTPPGEEGVGVWGQLCQLPSICLSGRSAAALLFHATKASSVLVNPKLCTAILCFCGMSDVIGFVFLSSAVEICHQLLHHVVTLSSSLPCPSPPYRCPPPPSLCLIILNKTVWIFHIYFFFSFPPLFCLLVTAFGISRTARTP